MKLGCCSPFSVAFSSPPHPVGSGWFPPQSENSSTLSAGGPCRFLAEPQQADAYDIAPFVLYTKKPARPAISLWVMKGGLNFPFEILEPVGKPQVFKCRKSWFYKMLIRSALGTSKQQGKEWTPPCCLHLAPLLLIYYTRLREELQQKRRGHVVSGLGMTKTEKQVTRRLSGIKMSVSI